MAADGYALVAESDRDGTSPGKELLTALLQRAAPCVVLLDELVAYIRQFESGKSYAGGTYDSNISFIQALTESMKAVPNAILLASLPESETESGGAQGQRALEALEKYFGRVESVWKPVATDEAFEIVRRRLFDAVGEASAVQSTARAFCELYRQHPAKFPADAQAARYEERIAQSYPIHPEVFDRLYEDWSTLDKFQRTRGVLQYMAIVIHRLWNTGDKEPLIMPGSLPLDDATVRNKSIHYLPTGWEPVIEREIDGSRSAAADIDGHDTRFGSVQAARRVARTIFLGSAPSNAAQAVRGIRVEDILLGSAQPGQALGTYEDVIKRLRDKLHYLYGEKDSYWFDTRPNLRREMESRKANLKEADEVLPMLRDRVNRVMSSKHSFSGVHVFTPSADIPDEYGIGPRLVVLSSKAAYRKADPSQAISEATEILEKRGESPRLKRNRLIFLAPDGDSLPRLKDAVRTYLAWTSIVDDVLNKRMDLGTYQADQARRAKDSALDAVSQMVRDTYRWLMAPSEEKQRDKMAIRWEAVAVSPAAPNLLEEIQRKLKEEEWVIYEWSPIHLARVLNQWFFKEGAEHVSALKVWQDSCHYLFLPRLADDVIYRNAITAGIATRDAFGYASAVEDGRYLGFMFGRSSLVTLDDSAVLVAKETSARYQAQLDQEAVEREAKVREQAEAAGTGRMPVATSKGTGGTPPPPATTTQPTRFFGTAAVSPDSATLDFSKIVNEVIQHFAAQSGVNVTVTIEIEATAREGFETALQRTVRENCGVLRFKNAQFES